MVMSAAILLAGLTPAAVAEMAACLFYPTSVRSLPKGGASPCRTGGMES